MSTDFIARWSRRKRGTDPSLAEPQVLPANVADGRAPVVAEADGAFHDVEGLEVSTSESLNEAASLSLTPEELAALPDPEELTAASDITGFLRSGVPSALRNRALRRMWSVDPAIRDAIGDARDYAWDWNVPGGMPVSGPISSSIDIDKMVRGIFGADKADEEPAPEAAPAPAVGETEQPVLDEARDVVAQVPNPEAPTPAEDMSAAGHRVASDIAEAAPSQSVRSRPLRHGGALPV
ncbi:MAG: DUF3306 domain-containing protein [Rhizobiaceae bacterium]|nr:DUF3306 domain-containing protein [Rhizobiaceae bacterium]